LKILESQVQKMEITDLVEDFKLDAVAVIIEDLSEGAGRITITCFGQAWTAYFGAMGGKHISEFFCSCDEDYLVDALSFRGEDRECQPTYLYRIIAAVQKALNDTRSLNEALGKDGNG